MYVVLYWNLNKKIDELIVKELISFNYKPAIHFSNKFMGCNIENKSHVPDNLQKGNNVIYKKIPIIIKGALIAIIDPLDDRILSYDYDYLRRGLAPF